MVYARDQLLASDPLLDAKIRHSLLPATTKEPQPAELGICFGFSAPALALSGFGHGFGTGCGLKGQNRWRRDGWRARGRANLIARAGCSACTCPEEIRKLRCLENTADPRWLFASSPHHPDTPKPQPMSQMVCERFVQPYLGCPR